ncbi:MAG: 5'-nucleotidase C-terminal domain-containing protein [Myxococcales bacterium]|nr:5'-nucleotidase C-terminal domain-containing protein [Myxococcales bacterium]
MSWRAFLSILLALLCAVSLAGCPENPPAVALKGQTKLTLIHTSDIHSRLFPYAIQITQSDASLGLGTADAVTTVGGVARMASVVARERAKSDRVLHIDGGDCFQGAPVFNFFDGEAEIRALSAMGIDAQVIANHEFDKGALNARTQLYKWANYPVLAANYLLDDPQNPMSPGLENVLQPFTTFNLRGLKVGVIGMGNLSSLSSLYERPSRLGITPLETIDVAQAYIDLLRPLVDVIVFVTHLGLSSDQEMIRGTTGIDVVLGGHNHIVLQPPQTVEDCARVDEAGQHYIYLRDADGHPKRRYCNPRRALLTHSGAFSKYVGRLDLVLSNRQEDLDFPYDPLNGFEIASHQYTITPITSDLPMDRAVSEVLEPYRAGLDLLVDLDLLVGFAPDGARRFGTGGGDSPLGNLISSAMWRRLGIETDFSLTNTTGIRADLVPGPITVEQMFNIFPFDNSISKMQLSGSEVQELFDFVARRSASRGCATQVQIAGARIVVNCKGCTTQQPPPCQNNEQCASNECVAGGCTIKACAEHIYIGSTDTPCSTDADCGNQPNACDLGRLDKAGLGRCLSPIDSEGSYELATSTYLAQGGSGFVVLKRNTTQLDTKIQQRDALIDWVRGGTPCGWKSEHTTSDGLKACDLDADCASVGPSYVCACQGNAAQAADGTCFSNGGCGGQGRCVVAKCRQSVADFYVSTCKNPESAVQIASCSGQINGCQLGGEQCKYLGCVDRNLGNFADGRVRMVGK